MLLTDYLTKYLTRNLNISPQYAVQLTVAVRLLNRHRPRTCIRELSGDVLTSFAKWLQSQDRSARTINGRVATIATLWRAATLDGVPCQPIPRRLPRLREPVRLPSSWSIEDVGRILDHCGTVTARRGWTGDHWRTLLLTVWDSAIRIGSARQLRRCDLDARRNLFVVPAEAMKTRRDHIAPIHPQTTAEILLLPRTSELIWPWPYHPHDLWRIFRDDFLHPLGLHQRGMSMNVFHRLRRTSATYVASAGGYDLARLHLGHLTAGLAERCYIDARRIDAQRPCDLLPRPGRKSA